MLHFAAVRLRTAERHRRCVASLVVSPSALVPDYAMRLLLLVFARISCTGKTPLDVALASGHAREMRRVFARHFDISDDDAVGADGSADSSADGSGSDGEGNGDAEAEAGARSATRRASASNARATLRKGQRVRAKRDFLHNKGDLQAVRAGAIGTVQSVDSDGDYKVR